MSCRYIKQNEKTVEKGPPTFLRARGSYVEIATYRATTSQANITIPISSQTNPRKIQTPTMAEEIPSSNPDVPRGQKAFVPLGIHPPLPPPTTQLTSITRKQPRSNELFGPQARPLPLPRFPRRLQHRRPRTPHLCPPSRIRPPPRLPRQQIVRNTSSARG